MADAGGLKGGGRVHFKRDAQGRIHRASPVRERVLRYAGDKRHWWTAGCAERVKPEALAIGVGQGRVLLQPEVQSQISDMRLKGHHTSTRRARAQVRRARRWWTCARRHPSSR